MFEQRYKQVEKTIVILMLVGILAMFQPWFQNAASWLEGLSAGSEWGQLYGREIAPTIFRYGFYTVLLSTVAFISISHYSVDDLQRAINEKGQLLTWLLVAMPIIVGFTILVNLSIGAGLAAFVGVFAFIYAISTWNWRRRGVIGLAVVNLGLLVLGITGRGDLGTAVLNTILTIAIIGLIWPRREKLY
ncbi:MAG: hypothetical protein IPM53_14970 [Anaerolineaceae bacterium]|nr:hypothetical protein [Anaerolineaceae bacterium]